MAWLAPSTQEARALVQLSGKNGEEAPATYSEATRLGLWPPVLGLVTPLAIVV